MTLRSRRFGVACLVGLGVCPAASQGQITVGKNVLVSADNPRAAHGEMLMAADGDPTRNGPGRQRLVVCAHRFGAENEAEPGRFVTVYTSHDAGARWKATLDARGGDPACAFGLGGVAYVANLRGSVGGFIYIYRSPDGGMTWDPAVKIPGIDREYLTVDTTSGMYRGQVYVNGTHSLLSMEERRNEPVGAALVANGFAIFRSADSGRTFSGPAMRVAVKPKIILGMGNAVVLSDGTLAAVTGEIRDNAHMFATVDRPKAKLFVVTSKNGGESVAAAEVIDDFWMDEITGAAVPSMAVDPGSPAFKDRLYVVWSDARSGHTNILLSTSADRGKSWTRAIRINDDEETGKIGWPRHTLPRVVVNRHGVVGVAWCDGRDHVGSDGYDPERACVRDAQRVRQVRGVGNATRRTGGRVPARRGHHSFGASQPARDDGRRYGRNGRRCRRRVSRCVDR
jgi:hypothetical protein